MTQKSAEEIAQYIYAYTYGQNRRKAILEAILSERSRVKELEAALKEAVDVLERVLKSPKTTESDSPYSNVSISDTDMEGIRLSLTKAKKFLDGV